MDSKDFMVLRYRLPNTKKGLGVFFVCAVLTITSLSLFAETESKQGHPLLLSPHSDPIAYYDGYVLAVFVLAVFVLAVFVLAVFVLAVFVLAVFGLAVLVLTFFFPSWRRDNGGATGPGQRDNSRATGLGQRKIYFE